MCNLMRKLDNLVVGGDCQYYVGYLFVKVFPDKASSFNTLYKDYFIEIFPLNNPNQIFPQPNSLESLDVFEFGLSQGNNSFEYLTQNIYNLFQPFEISGNPANTLLDLETKTNLQQGVYHAKMDTVILS